MITQRMMVSLYYIGEIKIPRGGPLENLKSQLLLFETIAENLCRTPLAVWYKTNWKIFYSYRELVTRKVCHVQE